MGEVADALDLSVLELPIRLRPIPVAMIWHERLHADPGHTWLRARITAVTKRVLSR